MRIYNKLKTSAVILLVVIVSMNLISCSSKKAENTDNLEINIGYQFGTAYFPLEIIQINKIIEKKYPNATISWKQLGNTAAIREGMLSGDIDFGFMAIPPFLIGYDKGMNWKAFTGLSSVPSSLVVNSPSINTLADFTAQDKIALPQQGSVQHILLSMAADKAFNEPKKFDSMLLAMSHPDAMDILRTKNEIKGHFTTPPYTQMELKDKDMKIILESNEAFGEEFTFIIGAGKIENETDIKKVKILNEAIKDALIYIEANPEESAAIFSDKYNMTIPESKDFMNMEGVKFNQEIKGVNRFSEFMNKVEYISKAYNEKEVIWDGYYD